MSDPVNHPGHYTSHPSGVEAIQITEHMGFNLGNAMKYIWRADLKDDAIEDLEKARWYVERELNRRRRPAAGLNAEPIDDTTVNDHIPKGSDVWVRSQSGDDWMKRKFVKMALVGPGPGPSDVLCTTDGVIEGQFHSWPEYSFHDPIAEPEPEPVEGCDVWVRDSMDEPFNLGVFCRIENGKCVARAKRSYQKYMWGYWKHWTFDDPNA